MSTCKKFYKYYNEIPTIHNEWKYIDVNNLYELIKLLLNDENFEKFINIGKPFFHFKKHDHTEYLKNKDIVNELHDYGHLLCIYTSPFTSRNNEILTKLGCPNKTIFVLLKLINRFNYVFNKILNHHKIQISKIHSIIFTGKFEKIKLEETKKYNNKYDLVVNLNYRYIKEDYNFYDNKCKDDNGFYAVYFMNSLNDFMLLQSNNFKIE